MNIKKVILYLSLLIPITLLAGSDIIEPEKAIMDHKFTRNVTEKKLFLGGTHIEKTITVIETCKVIILLPKKAGSQLTLEAADKEMNRCFRKNTGKNDPYQPYEHEDGVITEEEQDWVRKSKKKL